MFDSRKNIYFVGIGGIGASGLAQLLKSFGKLVSGSDQEASVMTEKLSAAGIPVFIGHSAERFKNGKKPDLIINSLAVPKSNPELVFARRHKIPIMTYPEAVGELTRHYYTIAVCGTHGKTTVTAMLAKILIENNFDPTVIVGTTLKELGGSNMRAGKSKILVLEACEYKRAFLNYQPRIILLNTIDPDHLDYYKNFRDYTGAFDAFALRLPRDGYFFANIDDDDVHEVLKMLQRKAFPAYNTFTYGMRYGTSDFWIQGDAIFQKNKKVGELHLKIPGQHNRINALAAFSVAATLGIKPLDILKSLNRYEGAARRFEMKGKIGKTLVIDDYGHHPVEIRATLQAAREKFPKQHIAVVFQPHQHSRTKLLLKEFGEAFGDADTVIIPNIYRVRDSLKDVQSVSAQDLVREIKKHHKNVFFGDGIEKTTEFLQKNSKKFDVIMTMGAGDVWKIGEALLH